MCSGRDTCMFLLDPEPGADRAARTHLRAWLTEQHLAVHEVNDVLTAVTEAVDGVTVQERRDGRRELVQVNAVVDDDGDQRGVALRVVDQGTMPISRGDVSGAVDYAQVMMRSAMDEVATRNDPQGGTVITMRTRPLARPDHQPAS